MAEKRDPRWVQASQKWDSALREGESKANLVARRSAGLEPDRDTANRAAPRTGPAGRPEYPAGPLPEPHRSLLQDARTTSAAARPTPVKVEIDYPSMRDSGRGGIVCPGRGTPEQAEAYRRELARLGLGGPSVGNVMVIDTFRQKS
jgi:hypothetical protein